MLTQSTRKARDVQQRTTNISDLYMLETRRAHNQKPYHKQCRSSINSIPIYHTAAFKFALTDLANHELLMTTQAT